MMSPAQPPCRRRAIYAMRSVPSPTAEPPVLSPPEPEAQIKRKAGWPKGKPRKVFV